MVKRVEAVIRKYDALGTMHRQAAREVIAAMREPTPSMTVEGDEAVIELLQDHTFALKEVTPALKSWRAMIDEALR